MPEYPIAQNDETGLTSPVSGLACIVLTGFMGAGKTTVGALLAAHLGWRFLDIDREIELAYGSSVADLFARHGEPWFRAVEHETIRRLLDATSQSAPLVLALGGGAIEDERTRTLLLKAPQTRLIHLEASLETVLDRCRGTEALRPILRDHANLESRYNRRLPLYRQASINLPVDDLTAESTAATLLTRLFPAA